MPKKRICFQGFTMPRLLLNLWERVIVAVMCVGLFTACQSRGIASTAGASLVDDHYLVPKIGEQPWRSLSNGIDAHLFYACSSLKVATRSETPCDELKIVLTPHGVFPSWAQVVDRGSITIHSWQKASTPIWSAYRDTDFRVLAMNLLPSTITMVSPDAAADMVDWDSVFRLGTESISLTAVAERFCPEEPQVRLVVTDRHATWVFAEWNSTCAKGSRTFIPSKLMKFSYPKAMPSVLDQPLQLFYIDRQSNGYNGPGSPRLVTDLKDWPPNFADKLVGMDTLHLPDGQPYLLELADVPFPPISREMPNLICQFSQLSTQQYRVAGTLEIRKVHGCRATRDGAAVRAPGG